MKKLLTEKRKKAIIVYLILWLILAIVFVMPMAVAYVDSTNPLTGVFSGESFMAIVGDHLLNIETRISSFESRYISITKKFLGYYTFLYASIMITLILKSKSTGDYHDIEHGSSDWCVGGEQYKILSKKEGLILAEKNYLPVDKPGNVNVLIVGRIRCW